MPPIFCGVYQIKNLTNGKVYVGSSKNIAKRFYEHKRTLQKNQHHSLKLQRAWNLYGEDAFSFSIVLHCAEDALIDLEQRCIDYSFSQKNGYNVLPNAKSNHGFKMSDETKRKLSIAHLGKITSDETRVKLSIANKGKQNTLGKTLSEEHKRKIGIKSKGNSFRTGVLLSDAHKAAFTRRGSKVSDETKSKMSAARIGTKLSPESIEKRTATRLLNKLKKDCHEFS